MYLLRLIEKLLHAFLQLKVTYIGGNEFQRGHTKPNLIFYIDHVNE